MQTVAEKRKEILEKELKRIVDVIIKGYSPEKVILFWLFSRWSCA